MSSVSPNVDNVTQLPRWHPFCGRIGFVFRDAFLREAYQFYQKSFTYLKVHPWINSSLHVDQILMPMAGLGSRFKNYTEPKPLISVQGIPMFERALQSLPKASKTVLVTLESIQESFRGRESSSCQIKWLKETPSGQALSTQAGIDDLNTVGDVIVSSCDHGIVLNHDVWGEFQRSKSQYDAGIFTVKNFPGVRRSPNAFAYVKVQDETKRFGSVKTVSVKAPISEKPSSDDLLVGTFWFRDKEILKSGIEELIKKNIRVNGELYLDSIFEILVSWGLNVVRIPLEGYLGWGDPSSLEESLFWERVFV